MKYSYEYKRMCVELYRQGIYPDTPEGLTNRVFRRMIRVWYRMEEANGPEVLRHNERNKEWTAEDKFELISQALAGKSIDSVAVEAGISRGQLYNWYKKYEIYGYNGLVSKQKGRKSNMKKVGTRKPKDLNESEYEELIRLRAENKYIKAEIEAIKKEIALREEKEVLLLKAKKQR